MAGLEVQVFPIKGVTLVKKNRSADTKNKKKLKKKYVPPALMDYGNVTKITSAPKTVSGPDSTSTKKGSCL